MIEIITNIVVCLSITTITNQPVKCECCHDGYLTNRIENVRYEPFYSVNEVEIPEFPEYNKTVSINRMYLRETLFTLYGKNVRNWPSIIPLCTYEAYWSYDGKQYTNGDWEPIGIMRKDLLLKVLDIKEDDHD